MAGRARLIVFWAIAALVIQGCAFIHAMSRSDNNQLISRWTFADTANASAFLDSGSAHANGVITTCAGQYQQAHKQSLLVRDAQGNSLFGLRTYAIAACCGYVDHVDAFNTEQTTVSVYTNWFYGDARAPIFEKAERISLRWYRGYLEAQWTACVRNYPYCKHSTDSIQFVLSTYPYEVGYASPAQWYHVAATYNSQEAVLYINGNRVAFAPTNGTKLRGVEGSKISPKDRASHKYAVMFGSKEINSDNEYAAGWYSDTRIYQEAMSASDVATLAAGLSSYNKSPNSKTVPQDEIAYHGWGWREDVVNSTNQVLYNAWLPANRQHKLSTSIKLNIKLIDLQKEPAAITAVQELNNAQQQLHNAGVSQVVLQSTERADPDLLRILTSSEAFAVQQKTDNTLVISARSAAGLLYGAHHVIRCARTTTCSSFEIATQPSTSLRIINLWSYMRGFPSDAWMPWSANDSFGDPPGERADSILSWTDILSGNLGRIEQFARLLSSVGINALSPTDPDFQHENYISAAFLPAITTLAQTLDKYAIKLYWTGDYALAFNKTAIDLIYKAAPKFGGFVLKLGSEEQPGSPNPNSTNTIASYLAPYGGSIVLRAFIYGKDYPGTRVTAAKEFFGQYDGQYAPNVVIIGKYCPIDFEVHEVANPLDGAMRNSRYGTEWMVSKPFVMSWAREWSNFMHFDNGYGYHTINGSSINAASVSAVLGSWIVGPRVSWTGQPINIINLYTFGRLAFDSLMSPEQIYLEWSQLTFGNNPNVTSAVTSLLQLSESIPHDASMYHGYRGVWFKFTNDNEIDGSPLSTMLINSTFIGALEKQDGTLQQYSAIVNALYSNYQSAASERVLLLWQRFPYTYKLSNGKTLLEDLLATGQQAIVNAQQLISIWHQLEGKIDNYYYSYQLQGLQHNLGSTKAYVTKVAYAFRNMH